MRKYKNWSEVPENLKSKTALSKEGLKLNKNQEHEAEVYQFKSRDWIKLYDMNKAIPKKKMSEKQIAALEKARKALEEKQTCPRCGYRQTYIVGDMCTDCEEYEEYLSRKKQYEARIRSWFDDEKYIILDTETTGLESDDVIIEMSIINLKGETLLDSLISPLKADFEEATALHGISQEMLESAPKWSEIWPSIQAILKDKIILIYNAEFDERMIDQTCAVAGVEPIELKTICIMDLIMQYEESKYWTSLSNAVSYCVDHRAKADCLAVLDLLKQISKDKQTQIAL